MARRHPARAPISGGCEHGGGCPVCFICYYHFGWPCTTISKSPHKGLWLGTGSTQRAHRPLPSPRLPRKPGGPRLPHTAADQAADKGPWWPPATGGGSSRAAAARPPGTAAQCSIAPVIFRVSWTRLGGCCSPQQPLCVFRSYVQAGSLDSCVTRGGSPTVVPVRSTEAPDSVWEVCCPALQQPPQFIFREPVSGLPLS